MNKLLNKIKAFWKYCLSFRKTECGFSDYPVRIRFNRASLGTSLIDLDKSDWTAPRYIAQIIYWGQMSGHGDTRNEAKENLRERFHRYKMNGKRLSRPGTRKLLVFAGTTEVDKYRKLADEFLICILERDPSKTFISDKSKLPDFSLGYPIEPLLAQIQERYGVDVSDIKDGNLAKIFQRIGNEQSS